MHLALAFNPSHLEIVDPVVAGSRAFAPDPPRRQRAQAGAAGADPRRRRVRRPGRGDGTVPDVAGARFRASAARVHIVINNQVGFTTSAARRRALDAVLHRRGQDGRRAGAARERRRSGSGGVLRRAGARLPQALRQGRGHRPGLLPPPRPQRGRRAGGDAAADVPGHPRAQDARASCTPSALVARRRARAPTRRRRWSTATAHKLDDGAVTTEVVEVKPDEFTIDWSKYLSGKLTDPVDTTFDAQEARQAGRRPSTTSRPTSSCIRAWPRSTRTAARWRPASSPSDWGFAENLAYATLLDEGYKLRLVGQDCGRGTFFHRHAILHDQTTDEYVLPLRHLVKNPIDVTIIDSLLQRGSGDGVRVRLRHRRSRRRWTSGKRSSATSPTARRS